MTPLIGQSFGIFFRMSGGKSDSGSDILICYLEERKLYIFTIQFCFSDKLLKSVDRQTFSYPGINIGYRIRDIGKGS